MLEDALGVGHLGFSFFLFLNGGFSLLLLFYGLQFRSCCCLLCLNVCKVGQVDLFGRRLVVEAGVVVVGR